jgi:hypothetical protein
MQYIQDIAKIYDEHDERNMRCLVALPNDSRTYILDDYEEGWDYHTAQNIDETELTLLDRDTLAIVRTTFDNSQRILREGNHIRVIEDRIEDRVQRIFTEAEEGVRPVILRRINGMGTFKQCDILHVDSDWSLVFIGARYENYDNLHILILTDKTILNYSEDDGVYLLDGEYFVNSTSRKALMK